MELLEELTKKLYRAAGKLNFYIFTYNNHKLKPDVNKLKIHVYETKKFISRIEKLIDEKYDVFSMVDY